MNSLPAIKNFIRISKTKILNVKHIVDIESRGEYFKVRTGPTGSDGGDVYRFYPDDYKYDEIKKIYDNIA